MGRKSSAKSLGQTPPPPPAPSSSNGLKPVLWVVVALVAALGAFLLLRPAAEPELAAADTSASASPAASTSESAPPVDPAVVARAAALASLGPREQASLPPVPFGGYQPARDPEVITAAYEFAAEHPEILSYVPCYCGCERSGHQGNHDCFVKTRDENGDVTEWDEHGVACAVCIDVANRSRQLHASGASVRDIRAAIEKEFAALYPGKMNVPHPPAAHSH